MRVVVCTKGWNVSCNAAGAGFWWLSRGANYHLDMIDKSDCHFIDIQWIITTSFSVLYHIILHRDSILIFNVPIAEVLQCQCHIQNVYSRFTNTEHLIFDILTKRSDLWQLAATRVVLFLINLRISNVH